MSEPINPPADHGAAKLVIRTRAESILTGLLLVATAAFYLWWAGAPSLIWATREPRGYDAMQADALLAGQLYLKTEPNPVLLHLADPYDPAQYGPYHLIDLSFYRGRYYLHFGVAPVVTLFLPWQAITGTCLTDEAGAAVFATAGFVLSVLLLRSLRRRYFVNAPSWAFLIATGVLALGNLSLLLLRYPNYPQIPIASAWMWQIAALAAVYAALHARRPWPWLALASGACGLAVASRPTFLLGALLLVPAAVGLTRVRPSGASPTATIVRPLLAALLPIGAIGVGLMIYNQLRFDSPFEFGMHYQLAGGHPRQELLLSPRFVPAHAFAYLFSIPQFTRYFPFIEDQLRPLGVLTVLPFTWLVLLVPVGLRAQPREVQPGLRTLVASAALAFAGNFLLLSHYYSNWPRYQLDFFLVLSWLAALGLVSAAPAGAGPPRRLRLLGAAATLLAGINIGVSFCFAARSYHAPQKLAALAWLAMRPVGWFETAGHTGFGPLHLAVKFPANRTVRMEPLLSAGTAGGDLVYVRYLDQDYVQLGLFHAGLGYFDGEPVIPLPRAWHAVDIDLGSLYPPPNHPQFDRWTPEEILRARTRLTLTLDGQTVLARDFLAHPGTPADIRIGERPAGLTIGEPRFTGRITVTGRGPLAPTSPWFTPSAAGGAVLTLRFGPRRTGYSEPLVCSGQTRDGDVLFVTYLDHDHVQFGVDSWTRGVVRTDPVEVPDGRQPHRLGVWMPPLAGASPAAGGGTPAMSGRLTITWDDRLLWDGPCPLHAAPPGSVYFGINPIGASSTEPIFAGQFLAIRSTDPQLHSGSEEAPPDAPVSLLLQFPRAATGGSEPLVVTGRPGAGDFVYVRYLGENQVRFGFDHWGVGGALGDPVAVDPAGAHRVEITMGSLYGGARSGPAARRVEVKLDGQTVLAAASPCHPAHPHEWYIGENPIGGSTCGERFTGRLLLVERGAAP